jgi:hypothetical protein
VGFGRSSPRVGAADRRRKWRLRLTATALIPVVVVCFLVVVMSSHAIVRPSLAAARSAPDLGRTKATAVKARAGRTYTVTLASKSSQRWLVVKDPYDPYRSCYGLCRHGSGRPASALVEATVQSRGGVCVARAILHGPTFNAQSGFAERQLGRGLVPSGTSFTAVAVPTWYGRVYLRLSPDRSFGCSNGRYAVRFTVQPALGFNVVEADSASAAQYSQSVTTLEQHQRICFDKGQALDRYTESLTRQIGADRRRHGLGRRIAQLKAAINTANRRYRATPCPPK